MMAVTGIESLDYFSRMRDNVNSDSALLRSNKELSSKLKALKVLFLPGLESGVSGRKARYLQQVCTPFLVEVQLQP